MTDDRFIQILSSKNENIQKFPNFSSTSSFLELVALDFLSFLFANSSAHSYFQKRASYFDCLLVDEEFIKVEKALKQEIMDLGKFVNKPKFFNKATEDFAKRSGGGKWGYLTVPLGGYNDSDKGFTPFEVAKFVFDPESYLPLGDQRFRIFKSENGTISYHWNVFGFFDQYLFSVKFLMRHLILAFLSIESKEKGRVVLNLQDKLICASNDLERMLLVLPKQLKYINYETLSKIYESYQLVPGTIPNDWYEGMYSEVAYREELKKMVQSVFEDVASFADNSYVEALSPPRVVGFNDVSGEESKQSLLVLKTNFFSICYSQGGFYLNDEDEPFYSLQRGQIPIKLWAFAQQKKELFLSWDFLQKQQLFRTQLEDSLNKTHRPYLFSKIKKVFKKDKIQLPQDLFEKLLRAGSKDGQPGIFLLKS